MSRLIDADALVQMPWVLPNRMTRETALECFRNIVSEAPAIDAEPVRHGELISTGFDEIYCEWGNCSKCGADNMMSNTRCCECGAHFDGRDDEK